MGRQHSSALPDWLSYTPSMSSLSQSTSTSTLGLCKPPHQHTLHPTNTITAHPHRVGSSLPRSVTRIRAHPQFSNTETKARSHKDLWVQRQPKHKATSPGNDH